MSSVSFSSVPPGVPTSVFPSAPTTVPTVLFPSVPTTVPAPVYPPSAPPTSTVIEGGYRTVNFSDISIYHSNQDLYLTEGPLTHEALDFAMESHNAVQSYLPKKLSNYEPPKRTMELRNHTCRHQSFRSHHSLTLVLAASFSIPTIHSPYHHSGPSPSLFGRGSHEKKEGQDPATTLFFVIAGAVGALIFLTGVYFLGKEIMRTYDKFKEAKGVSEIERNLQAEQKEYKNVDLDAFVRLSENRHKLHNSEKRWAMWKTALLTTTIAAAAIIIVGAIVGVIPAVASGVGAPIVFAATAGAAIAVGGAILFAVGTVALFSLGIYQASIKSYRKDLAAAIDKDATYLVNRRGVSPIYLTGYRPSAAV